MGLEILHIFIFKFIENKGKNKKNAVALSTVKKLLIL